MAESATLGPSAGSTGSLASVDPLFGLDPSGKPGPDESLTVTAGDGRRAAAGRPLTLCPSSVVAVVVDGSPFPPGSSGKDASSG